MTRIRTTSALIALLLAAGQASGQAPGLPDPAAAQATVVQRDMRGTPSWVTGRLGTLEKGRLEESAASLLPQWTELFFGATRSEEFVRTRSSQDSTGNIHIRFQQSLRGLPVFGAELIVHANVESGEVFALTGHFLPDVGLPEVSRLSSAQALEMAQVEAGVTSGEILGTPQLSYILLPKAERAYLAWSARIRYENPEGGFLTDILYADAENGALIVRLPRLIPALYRETYTANNQPVLPGTLLISEGGSSSDPVAQTAHDHTGQVYYFYSDVFDRDSLDGLGLTLVSTVHYRADPNVPFNNAGYDLDRNQMIYGDGDGSLYDPFGNSFDFVAHEMQHGVSAFEGLQYSTSQEVSALHESLSDIFAAAAEAHEDGGINANTWMIGEDTYTPGTPGDASRYLNDPALDGRSIDYYPEYNWRAAPHYRAGIINLAFYLLTDGGPTHMHPRGKTTVYVTPIGMDESQLIFYEALKFYLGPFATFDDLRLGALQAAQTLYGSGSIEHQGTQEAFCAVGMSCTPGVCFPPVSGDWFVVGDCTLEDTATAPANVIVQNNATLTVASSAALDIDLTQYHLLVQSGSRVVVKSGGQIH